jgi:hypothetical protein
MDNRGMYFSFRLCDDIVQDLSILMNYPEKSCFDEKFADIKLTPTENVRLMCLINDIVKREKEEADRGEKRNPQNRVLKYFEDDIQDVLHKSAII